MNRLLKIGPIGTLCAVALANLAVAADLPKEGKYDYTTCFTRTVTYVEYSPTQTAWSYRELGRSVSDPLGGMFEGDEVQCLGMTASLDGKRNGSTACVGIAKDGAKRFTRFWYDRWGVSEGDHRWHWQVRRHGDDRDSPGREGAAAHETGNADP